ncbi:MAG: YgiT-type zinc finger protein [Acidobacteriota bacterium]
MAVVKDCPVCGDRMKLDSRETVVRLPGSTQEVVTRVWEWVCTDCDHREEAEGPTESA